MISMYSIHRRLEADGMRYASRALGNSFERRFDMLWTIFVMLLILWFLGLVSSYTLGGYIHLLLVVALIVLLVNLLTGRRGAI
jgi:hypothetical protein